nr:hypothetical protein [Leucobacter chinensis]
MGYNIALLIGGGELVGPGDGLLLRGLVEDGLKRCGGVHTEGVVFIQVDAGKEGLVREALVLVVAALVHSGEISCEIKGSVDEVSGSLVVVVVLSDLSLDPVKFCSQPGLELLQLVQRERLGQVCFQELVLLSKDLLAPISEVSDGLVSARGQLVELVHQHAPQCVGHRWREGDALVVVRDELLNPVHRRIRHVTGRALVVAAQTDEIRVDVAVPVLGVDDRHPLTTPSTEQGALQVVVMLLRADPGLGVGAQNGLHLIPDFWLNEPFVCPVISDTPVDDISLVVRVLQHSMHARKPQRSRRAFRGWHRAQALVREFDAKLGEAVVSRCVGGERPLHQARPVGVLFDATHFAAEFVAVQGVEVADRGAHRGAAGGCLLHEALHHLVGEVDGVELRDRGHDAVKQHPGWGFVDVLCRGDKYDACFAQGEVNLDVVGAVAGEPVNLVDDAVSDFVSFDVGDHLPQRWPVCFFRGLACVNELFDDRSA